MKPRYAIINDYERTKFEKEWQMPYGYGRSPMLSMDAEEAKEYLIAMSDNPAIDINDFIVEKISEEGREIYFRI